MPNAATLTSIYRYPLKGLSPQPYQRVTLCTGQTLPNDRRYAVENGPSGFDPAAPAWLSKANFLMLMRNERLARLDTHFDDETHMLTVREGDHEAARGDLRTPDGRQAIEAFFTGFCADELRGPPRVLHAPGHSFSDVAKKVVSIVNLASVAEIETRTGAAVDPLRFRANLYVEGWPAWGEFELIGQILSVGAQARLKVVKRIMRCAATNVEPGTGIRDLTIPATLTRSFDHADCGIYAEVIAGGPIAAGDRIDISSRD